MPIPNDITEISTTPGNNYPILADYIGTSLTGYLQAIQAIIKQDASAGANIASASSITIPAAGNSFAVTGTTTIAGIAASWTGRTVVLVFSGALQLTHGAAFLLPGSANTTTAAGDVAIMRDEGAGTWRCISYHPAAIQIAEIRHLDGVTSALQTQIDSKQATISLTASRAVASDVSGALAASATTATELGYVSGVTSAIQTQIDGKEPAINLTASRAVVSDGSGDLAASATTATELGYVSGVSSAIQTQINGKAATITGAATTVAYADLTTARALKSDTSGKIVVSSTTAIELGYVDGVTSPIQTQIDSKQATITGGATTITSSNLTASRALESSSGGKVAVSAVTATELALLSGRTSLGSLLLGTVALTGSNQLEITGIPATATLLRLAAYGLTRPGATEAKLRLGHSGGYIESGYESTYGRMSDGGTWYGDDSNTGDVLVLSSIVQSSPCNGAINLAKITNGSTKAWMIDGLFATDTAGTSYVHHSKGFITTTSDIDRIIIVLGSGLFNSGGFAALFLL